MVKAFSKATLVAMALAVVLAACAPAQSAEQIQSQVATSVAMTVQAQGQMADAVAGTLTAQAPDATATSSPTPIPLNLPTLPSVATVTPFVVVPPSGGGSGGGGNTAAKYSCDFTQRPFDNTQFKPGDPFDIKWVITNTGTVAWDAGKDFSYLSGPHLTKSAGVELPALKPNHTVAYQFDANAPMEKGDYVMTWKVEGGLCYPYVAIHVGKPGDP